MLADVTANVPAAHDGGQQAALDAGLSASCADRHTPGPDHLLADSAFCTIWAAQTLSEMGSAWQLIVRSQHASVESVNLPVAH